MSLSISFAGALANGRPKSLARPEDSDPSSRSDGPGRARIGNRGARRRPGAAVVCRQVDCAGLIESLEDRLLLSASFATPSFVLEGRAEIASGSSRGASPHVTPANSGPITPA